MLLLLIPKWALSDHSQSQQIKLLILGDSLSAAYGMKQEQGWVSLLQNAWQSSNITVINAAMSGDTTDGGLQRLPQLLTDHQPTHLLIELGGNDGLQGHSVKKIRDNLSTMIMLAKAQNVKVLLQEIMIPTNYGKRYTTLFRQNYAELANQHQLPLIPCFAADLGLDPEMMMPDGIHPNQKAQPIIAKRMQQHLTPLLLLSDKNKSSALPSAADKD
jgi:acyl-CoA thioesterase-1